MSDKPFLASVLSGPNAGAVIALAGGRTVLGGTGHENIVLDGTAGDGLTVRLHDDGIRLRASAEGMAVLDGEPLPVGRALAANLPLTVRVGPETLVNFSRSRPVERRRGLPLMVSATVALMTLGVGLVFNANWRIDTNEAQALVAQPVAAVAPAAAPAAAAMRDTAPRTDCGDDCLNRLADAFRERLENAGLTGLRLSVSDRLIRVGGVLEPEQQALWQQVRAGFEAERRTSLPLVVAFGGTPDAPVARIAALWLGETPSVTLRDGRELVVNDELADGWRIARISREGVELTRDGAREVLKF